MIATPPSVSVRRHLKGEHSQWCQQRKGNALFWKWTAGLIRSVKLHQGREVER
jgi:hypothetical protein